MDIPLISPGWALFTGLAWDIALNLSEMARLGQRRWYWRLHAAYARTYRFDHALAVMRREAEQTGLSEKQLVYGETPGLSMLAMLARVGTTPQDVLFDLGCGRGIALMTAALQWKLEAVGVDAIPTFVERGNTIATKLGVASRIRFEHGDFLEQDLSRGTVFYAAATTFERDIVDDLAAKVAAETSTSGRPIRFITLSQPLLPPWKLIDKGRYPMTWGWNTVYFHKLESSVMSRSSSSA